MVIMNDIEIFRKGYRRIDEGGLNRIMHHGQYGFIVISAHRSEVYSSNPNCDLSDAYIAWCQKENKEVDDTKNQTEFLQIRNKAADDELRKRLKASVYSYTPVFGGYHGSDDSVDSFEPSYIVYNHAKGDSNAYLNFDDLFDFALDLTQEFNQESVYIQRPNEAPIYVNEKGEQVNKDSSKNFKFNDYEQEYFTTSKRRKRTTDDGGLETPPQRFTADINFESFYRKAGPSTYFDRMKRSKLGEVFLD